MIWERDALWAKSILFFERAFNEPPESSLFGLWCSLGLELLARGAVASISPTLLAEPDRDHRFLLHALDKADDKTSPQSIGAAQVFNLCSRLFANITKDHVSAALALVNRRNAELHSGEAAFEKYPSRVWLPGFYRMCHELAMVLGESLENLFGDDEAEVALRILSESRMDAKAQVQSAIAAHRKVFETKSKEERSAAVKAAKAEAKRLAHEGHHRVTCPSCASEALVRGDTFGPERVAHDEDHDIIVRQSVSPRSFSCSVCGLKLADMPNLTLRDSVETTHDV